MKALSVAIVEAWCQKRGFCVHVWVCLCVDRQMDRYLCVCVCTCPSAAFYECMCLSSLCACCWGLSLRSHHGFISRDLKPFTIWLGEKIKQRALHLDFWIWLSCLPRPHSVNQPHFQSTRDTLKPFYCKREYDNDYCTEYSPFLPSFKYNDTSLHVLERERSHWDCQQTHHG